MIGVAKYFHDIGIKMLNRFSFANLVEDLFNFEYLNIQT